MQTAIQAIYRDLDYAKSLVKARVATQEALATAEVELDDGNVIEEEWTWIGDMSDPDLQKLIQERDGQTRGRVPRVSMDQAGQSLMQGVERSDTLTKGKSRK